MFCEKPIASNAAEAERMAQVADETGLLLVEAFHYRYHPLADRIRELIRTEAIGKLQRVEANFSVPIPPNNIRFDWDLAGGATMDLGCYPLHMIRYFSGMTPRVIAAKAQVGPPNIDVTMEADLELAPGVSARMTCSMAADAQLGASFLARGDRGELKATNPVGTTLGTSAHGYDARGNDQRNGARRHQLHPSAACLGHGAARGPERISDRRARWRHRDAHHRRGLSRGRVASSWRGFGQSVRRRFKRRRLFHKGYLASFSRNAQVRDVSPLRTTGSVI